MKYAVKIRRKDYEVEDFNDFHLIKIQKFCDNFNDLSAQFDLAFLLKEVIIPSVEENIIKISANGRYILLLDSQEINDVIEKLVEIFYKRRIEIASAQNDSEAVARYKGAIDILKSEVRSHASEIKENNEIEALKAELEALKAKQN